MDESKCIDAEEKGNKTIHQIKYVIPEVKFHNKSVTDIKFETARQYGTLKIIHKKNTKADCKKRKKKYWNISQSLELRSLKWSMSNRFQTNFFEKWKQLFTIPDGNSNQTLKEKSAFDKLFERYLASKEQSTKISSQPQTLFESTSNVKLIKKEQTQTIVTYYEDLGGVGDVSSAFTPTGSTNTHHYSMSEVHKPVTVFPLEQPKPCLNSTMNDLTQSGRRNEVSTTRRRKKSNKFYMTLEEVKAETRSWNLNTRKGETFLHKAVKIGNLNVVEYYLKILHSDPSLIDNAAYTPLHIACSRGRYQVAKLLLQYGANANDSTLQGYRPLHLAIQNEHTKVVKLLLDHGADPHLPNYLGITPLSMSRGKIRQLMETYISGRPHITIKEEKEDTTTNSLSQAPPVQETEEDSATNQSNIQPTEEIDFGSSSDLDGFEIEESTFPLPNLYRFSSEPHSDSWVLFHELSPHLKTKTKEALLKQLGLDSNAVFRDLHLSEFYKKAQCRALVPSDVPKTSKVTLVKYTDRVKLLLGITTTFIPWSENSKKPNSGIMELPQGPKVTKDRDY